jgi:hypothetical protein
VRYPVQAFDAVLRDVVLGDAEDVADLDAAAYLGAGPVVYLWSTPKRRSRTLGLRRYLEGVLQ